MRSSTVAGVCAGFAGGLLGAAVLGYFAGAHAAPQARQASIDAATIRLVDGRGKVRAELAMSPDGGPALFFFDGAGRNRLVLGLYSPSEREAPFVVLNDPGERAAGIFRLFGANDAPVVVLKNAGYDRSIYGLGAQTLEPFLVNYAADGKKEHVFGKY